MTFDEYNHRTSFTIVELWEAGVLLFFSYTWSVGLANISSLKAQNLTTTERRHFAEVNQVLILMVQLSCTMTARLRLKERHRSRSRRKWTIPQYVCLANIATKIGRVSLTALGID